MFGISITNNQFSIVYGLPKGHWPGTEGPDSIISMLNHWIESYIEKILKPGLESLFCMLIIALGRTKSISLMVLQLFSINRMFEEVVLYFLVTGHTKKHATDLSAIFERNLL